MKVRKRIKNVFENWKEDTYEQTVKAYMIDKEESDNFYIDTLIKDKEDGERVAEILLSKWDYIKVYHRHG